MKKRKFITAVFTVLVSAMLACMPASCQNAAKNTAVLILSDTGEIAITAETEDGSAITVEGCTETALASSRDRVNKTVLHARGKKVVLKGKIIKLDCRGNNLTELNVQGLPLQRLECSGNQLTELNVKGLTSLQELLCNDNQLTELNVQGLPLQTLECNFNQLTKLNVQGLTSLQMLLCRSNQLTELNVQGLTSLHELDCGDNQLNKEAFTKLFKDLSDRSGKNTGKCILYTEIIVITQGNYRNFTAEELKVIKDKNWLPSYTNSSLRSIEIQ